MEWLTRELVLALLEQVQHIPYHSPAELPGPAVYLKNLEQALHIPHHSPAELPGPAVVLKNLEK